MIKEDIVEAVSKDVGLPKHECLQVVDSIIDSIKDILETGRKIEIREFGTFAVVNRKAKIGRIIATGGTVVVPPRLAPKFLPGRILKELVNQGAGPGGRDSGGGTQGAGPSRFPLPASRFTFGFRRTS